MSKKDTPILRIKEVLTEKGIKQKDLYEGVGLSQVYTSEIVRGISIPKVETLVSIAEFLDVDVRDLFHSTKDYGESIFIEQGTGKRYRITEIE